MLSKKMLKASIQYLIITLVSFFILQSILILMHEFTHSTTAWLLGCKHDPLEIVWGNPLLMTGWDEGVHYSKLFPVRGDIHEAVIGAMPLLLHAVLITLGLLLLKTKGIRRQRWSFHLIFWFIIANLMELTAYILMRPFAPNGDTGHFNRGLNISPWFLFIIGTLLLIYTIHYICSRVLPVMYSLFAGSNQLSRWLILSLTAFIIFLWGSGLRVIFYLYPDPQWKFGLLGLAGFIILLILYRPCVNSTDTNS